MSCTLKSDLYLAANGSGSAYVDLNLNKVFTEYIFDMQESMMQNPPEKRVLFDEVSIKDGFANSKSTELVSFSSETPNVLKMKIKFDDVNSLISEAEEGTEKGAKEAKDKIEKIMSFKKVGKNYKFKFYLDENNIEDLATLLPEQAKPMYYMFGPDKNITKKDYSDMLNELLVEYNAGDMNAVLEKSKIELTVKTDNKIISQKGGVLSKDKKSVKITIPFFDFIIIDKPIEIEVVFR